MSPQPRSSHRMTTKLGRLSAACSAAPRMIAHAMNTEGSLIMGQAGNFFGASRSAAGHGGPGVPHFRVETSNVTIVTEIWIRDGQSRLIERGIDRVGTYASSARSARAGGPGAVRWFQAK